MDMEKTVLYGLKSVEFQVHPYRNLNKRFAMSKTSSETFWPLENDAVNSAATEK